MIASIMLMVQGFHMTDHRAVALTPGNVIFYICLAVGFATLAICGFAIWLWDNIPANKLARLARAFAALFAAILVYGLGPILIVSALHIDPAWVDILRALPLLALLLWELKEIARRSKSAKAGPSPESPASPQS